MLSQLAHRSFGGGPLYAYTRAATAAVLLLAANTAFNDFPRVLFFMARDSQAPRVFLRMGDRLAFSNGIIALALVAAAIFVFFGGKTDPLIPLYAVGVFLAFAFSQAGMVVHWWRRRGAHWRKSMAINALGSLLSSVVFVIAGATKFAAGAWVAGVGIALIVVSATAIRHHYDAVSSAFALHPLAAEGPEGALAPRERTGEPYGDPSSDSGSEAEESPRGDSQPHDRLGRLLESPQRAGTRVRSLPPAARAGAPHQPERRGSQTLPRLLERLGRPPSHSNS